jgi:hypothetical protein
MNRQFHNLPDPSQAVLDAIGRAHQAKAEDSEQ